MIERIRKITKDELAQGFDESKNQWHIKEDKLGAKLKKVLLGIDSDTQSYCFTIDSEALKGVSPYLDTSNTRLLCVCDAILIHRKLSEPTSQCHAIFIELKSESLKQIVLHHKFGGSEVFLKYLTLLAQEYFESSFEIIDSSHVVFSCDAASFTNPKKPIPLSIKARTVKHFYASPSSQPSLFHYTRLI